MRKNLAIRLQRVSDRLKKLSEAQPITIVLKAKIEKPLWDHWFPTIRELAERRDTNMPEDLDFLSARILERDGKSYYIIDFA